MAVDEIAQLGVARDPRDAEGRQVVGLDLLLEAALELQHALRGEIKDGEPVDRFAQRAADEGEQQNQRVTVAALSVAGQITLTDQILGEEASQPRAQSAGISHRGLRSGCALCVALEAE